LTARATLAVDPGVQVKGTGGALVRALHEIADAGNYPVGLLSFQADNLAFYVRHRYKVISTSDEDERGLRS